MLARLTRWSTSGPLMTGASLIALTAGILLGVTADRLPPGAVGTLSTLVSPLADLWMNALQMVVLPFVLLYLLSAITTAIGDARLGALGARTLGFFVTMLVCTGLFTLVVASAMIGQYEIDAATVAAMSAGAEIPEAARTAAADPAASPTEWISGLLPRNLFAAASRGDLLPLLIFTVLFGIAVNRLPDAQRATIAGLSTAMSTALLQIVKWILVFTPFAVFAFSLSVASSAGAAIVGVLGTYVTLQCAMLLLVTLLLYPLSALFGRVSLGEFARALMPAQLVAISTRSSIAALPATVTGATNVLRLPRAATSFTLPLSVSLYKINRVISSPFKLLFLAHIYGVSLSVPAMLGFLVTVVLLSFTTVGLPSGGSAFKTLPVYVALGIPVEGLVLAEAVETIPDIFKTVLNVTANMNAATVLSRGERATAADAAPVPATELEAA